MGAHIERRRGVGVRAGGTAEVEALGAWSPEWQPTGGGCMEARGAQAATLAG